MLNPDFERVVTSRDDVIDCDMTYNDSYDDDPDYDDEEFADAIRKKLYRHLRAIGHPRWTEAMAFLIAGKRNRYFRWHDVGDLQSVEHLRNIITVARITANILHWLPTREHKLVELCLAQTPRPPNLIIRLSAHLIDGPLPLDIARKFGLSVSGVHRENEPAAFICGARDNDHRCGECRACWDADVPYVSYPLH